MTYQKGQLFAILPCPEIPAGQILTVDECKGDMVFFTDGTYAKIKDLSDGTWGLVTTIKGN